MPAFSSIDGIFSGFDTSAIIDSIIEYERLPVKLLENEQAEKTNIVSAYKALQAQILGLKTQVSRLAQTATFNASDIKVSDEEAIKATSTGKVPTGTYDVRVLSLARNHQIASQGVDNEARANFGSGEITIKVGSGSARTITIDSTNNSLVGIRKAINDANMGVRASIVNDGSGSNAYRLILAAEDTGVKNRIEITSELTGGTNLNFDSAVFDSPEATIYDTGSSSDMSLGATASYTGNENKIYTFKVLAGDSEDLTVGTDNITLEWSDGTNSGQIVVSQADLEYELVGAGADGLKVSLSAGELHAGDTFEVATFAPLLQDAANARIAFGSTGSGGSPITVTSDSNIINDVISGVRLELLAETGSSDVVNITTDVGIDEIKEQIQGVLKTYNQIMAYIDDQNTFDAETESAGILFGDRTLQIVQNSLQRAMGNRVTGITGEFNLLYSIGIRTGTDGQMKISDSSKLEEALRENLDDVIALFTDAGNTSTGGLEFISSGADTEIGTEFNVNITQAAGKGGLRGTAITDPSETPLTLTNTNNKFRLVVDGVTSNEIVLTAKEYNSVDELISEIKTKILGDSKIGHRGVEVKWVETSEGNGYIEFVSSSYGAGSTIKTEGGVADSALTALGLANATSYEGTDVEGTINGEPATGDGQYLTGDEDNATTAGLRILVTMEEGDLIEGVEGTVTVSRGIAARLDNMLDSLTASGDGLFDNRIASYQKQIDNIATRIADYDERLEARRQALYEQFYAMETALGELSSVSTYLENQLTQIDANWGFRN